MRDIYITGHINPDMDCTVSASAYAYLKNRIDPKNRYIAIRCGALNEQTKLAYKKAGSAPPTLYKKLVPTVGDIARRDYVALQADTPVFKVLELLYTRNLSFIPIFQLDTFVGTVSINEVAAYMLHQSNLQRPLYHFEVDNFSKVLAGKFMRKGNSLNFEAPIMAGAMPFNIYLRWMQEFTKKPLLVTGNRKEIIAHAIAHQLPAIIITGVKAEDEFDIDFSRYEGSIYLSDSDSAESIRLLRMSIPVSTIANRDLPGVQETEDFEDVKRLLMASDFRGLPVFRNETLAGIVTRRRFIEKPIKEVILMDHNEIHQSVPGAETARVVEIIDHHRFGAEKTNTPIYIAAKPVGSTSTIVYQHYLMHQEKIPLNIAILLQAGIISDTVNLKSPTTTQEDISALGKLALISGLDSEDYAREMFSQLKDLKERDPQDIITSDFKTYSQFGLKVGIGQVEVISLQEGGKMVSVFSQALDKVSQNKLLDWSLLLITDVIKQNSILVSSNFPAGMNTLIYPRLKDRAFKLLGILSRKKQLLPEVLRVAEELKAQP